MKDRIKELTRIAACDLRPFPKNPSIHTEAQAEAVGSLLNRFGFVDALKAFVATAADAKKLNAAAKEVESEETYSAGDVVVFDGHLRRDLAGRRKVQVLILKLDFDEVSELIASFDFSGSLKEYDRSIVADLFAGIDINAIGDNGFAATIKKQAETLDLFRDFQLPNIETPFADFGDDDESEDEEPAAEADRMIDFKFGDYRGKVSERVYRTFEAAYREQQNESGEAMLTDVLESWLDLNGGNDEEN